ncbi:hypothetical protein HK096_000296, partial [Nowakowskiella sp. JEL0078]
MSVYTHPEFFPVYSNIDTYQIYSTSQLVTRKSGMVIQPNKAIVGANAFAHESGIHQDGVLKNKLTYEIIQPEVIGLPSVALVLGKHSGRNAFRKRIEELLGEGTPYVEHLKTNPASFETLFSQFKKLADSKKSGVTDQDFLALIDDQLNIQQSGQEVYKLKTLQVFSGSDILATATVTLIDTTQPSIRSRGATPNASNGSLDASDILVDEGLELTDAAIGHGPVHAIFSAINRLIGVRNVLASYEVRAVTGGSDALGKVLVKIHEASENDIAESDAAPKMEILENGTSMSAVESLKERETFLGHGADEDILIASAKAYINAVNKMKAAKARKEALASIVDLVGVPESKK